jgi:hypothetical protein
MYHVKISLKSVVWILPCFGATFNTSVATATCPVNNFYLFRQYAEAPHDLSFNYMIFQCGGSQVWNGGTGEHKSQTLLLVSEFSGPLLSMLGKKQVG